MRAFTTLQWLSVVTLFVQSAQAQSTLIRGRVVDAKTNEPIPFATILLPAQRTGTLTQKDGIFQLTGSVEVGPDSLIVAPLGYVRSALWLPPGGLDNNLLLKVQPQPRLYPLWVEAKQSVSLLGSRLATPGAGAILGVLGTQYAFLYKNEKTKKTGVIRSVSFFIGESGLPRTAFRVRLYRASSLAGGPAADLLTESVITSTAHGGEWHTVDLSSYHIETPKEGFFVAMEWLAPCATDAAAIQNSPAICSQVMRPTFEFKESRTWSYTLGKGWQLVTLTNNGASFNAMMKAEVEYLQ